MTINLRHLDAQPPLLQRACVSLLLLIGLSLCCAVSAAAQTKSASASVPQLLEQLDAGNFEIRETAADQLVRLGVDSLKPMVLHSLSSSPESAWRIRSIIEKIGITGNEATFYKSTGILRLLYPLDDAGTSARLESLRQQWALARKNNAIKRLRELGATISDPLGNQVGGAPQAFGRRMVINGRVIVQGQQVFGQTQVNTSTTQANQASVRKRKSLTDRQLIQRVDELLESDLATNRERILGEGERPEGGGNQKTNLAQGNNPFAGNALRANQIRLGAMALFDEKFRGSANDLQALQAIPNLTLIHWKDRKLDAAEMESAHQSAGISRVHFENCQFPNAPLPESAWPRLATHYEFVNQTIPVSAIKRLRNSSVNSLKFSKCAASETLHQQLRQIKTLSQLALEDTLVDEDWFQSFASIGSLTRVDLSLCKFDSGDYRELSRIRPNLRINFTPQAFLGIRSSDLGAANLQRARMIAEMRAAAAKKANPDQQQKDAQIALPAQPAGCTISDVVKDSGAEKAGLKSGDVIVKLNGQPITVFEDIRLIIAQYRVGEKLDVEFTRDGQLKTSTIQLGRFPQNAIE